MANPEAYEHFPRPQRSGLGVPRPCVLLPSPTAVGRARHSVRAAPAATGHWIFPDPACQSCRPNGVPPGSPAGTPRFKSAPVPSRLVKPNPTKSINFAPVPFDPDPARLDACPPCSARRQECRATGTDRGRDGARRHPSLQTGRADFPHPAFQSVGALSRGSGSSPRPQVWRPDLRCQPSQLCLAVSAADQPLRALASVLCPLLLQSYFHLPASLRSTVVTRFAATTDALTPASQRDGLFAHVLHRHWRGSLITALGLPAIPSPTINVLSGDRPDARRLGLPPIARFAGFVFRSQTRPLTLTESSSRRPSTRTVCVTDWSFSFRCSPPRLTATQLRFDTARFFTAQKRERVSPRKVTIGALQGVAGWAT